MMNGLYGGLGQSIGSLLGGYLIQKLGGVGPAFRWCAMVEGAAAVLYGSFLWWGTAGAGASADAGASSADGIAHIAKTE
jgi:hypothetical protein